MGRLLKAVNGFILLQLSVYLTFRNKDTATLGRALRNRLTMESLVKTLNFSPSVR